MTAYAIRFVVDEGEDGERMDKVVSRRLSGLGRRGAARLFDIGAVRVNGRAAAKGALAKAGDDVEVTGVPAVAPEPEPGAPLAVLYESADVVVVDKPAGQPTAPIHGEAGTLAGALIARYPEMGGVGYRAREPGLLHRLDTQTSGVVVAARTAFAFSHLREALTAGKLDKRYLAIVSADGLPSEGIIDDPLAPEGEGGRRVVVTRPGAPGAHDAVTRWRRVARREELALVEVEVSRAYRHQIRVHLASIGHPIAGDALYGGPPAPSLGERHALHASHVSWAGDDAVQGFAADSPLPAELAALLSS